MALLFMDGFDHYDTNDILKKWTSTNESPLVGAGLSQNIAIHPSYARPPGGMGLRITGGGGRVRKSLSATQATFVAGMAVYFESLSASSFWRGNDTGSEQISLRIDASGHLLVSRNGTTLATSTSTFSINTWYHVEAKITINNSTGAYEVRVNGSVTGWIAAATSQNTRVTANNYINEFDLTTDINTRFDDVYILSSSSPNNDFIGPQKIITAFPTGVGNYAQWAGNFASNFANVNETQGDGDTTFNQSATANQIDSFAFDDVPAGTVTAIQHTLMARQDAGAARTFAALQRSSGTDYVGTTQNPSTSHLFFMDPKDQDPATSAAYTVSNLNAAEFGYKLLT